jgi:hypothetical protein
MSFGLSPALADTLGICTIESEVAIGMCVAFGECDAGLPTFAIQVSGSAAGCIAGNPAIDAASDGIGELLGEGVSVGLKSIGFGLSASGAFEMSDFAFWVGDDFSTTPVTTSGNIYQTVAVTIDGAVPEAVAKYIEVKGTMTVVLQLGTGNLEAEVKTIMSDLEKASPLAAIQELSKASIMGQFKITVGIPMETLTGGAVENLELGNVFEVNGMLSTQTVSSVTPGAYFYASDGDSLAVVMEDAMKWVAEGFGAIIDKIAGHSGVADKAVEAVTKVLGTSNSKQQFGFYVSETSVGIMLEFPVGSIFPMLGSIPLGTMSIQCQFHFAHGGATCGVDYGVPQWAAAIWKDAVMVMGPIVKSAEEAVSSLKAGVSKDWTEIKGGVTQAYKAVSEAVTKDADTVKNVATKDASTVKNVATKDASTVKHVAVKDATTVHNVAQHDTTTVHNVAQHDDHAIVRAFSSRRRRRGVFRV